MSILSMALLSFILMLAHTLCSDPRAPGILSLSLGSILTGGQHLNSEDTPPLQKRRTLTAT